MAQSNFKAPPSLSKCTTYETWLKEIKIWRAFTDYPLKKQGPAIFLTLEGKAREAVLELSVEKLSAETGVETLVEHLNKLYLKDKTQSAYEAYENFEKFRRPSDMSMTDFINEFERLHSKTKEHGTEMSADILAYRLLKSANLSDTHEQLAKATITSLTYDSMKTQLKKIFGDSSMGNSDPFGDLSGKIKSEPVFAAEDQHDTYFYSNRYNNGPRSRGQQHFRTNRFRTSRGGYNSRGSSGSAPGSNRPQQQNGRNPFDKEGKYTRCSICDSINHWRVNCPDAIYYEESWIEEQPEPDENSHHVTLYQSNLITDDHMKTFVAESFNMAILDSGATGTVAGKTWAECYIDSLPESTSQKLEFKKSSKSFKFGSNRVFNSLYRVSLPATIGTQAVDIEVDVVETDVPLLLSQKSMKKANTIMDFKNDTVTMLGETIKVHVTQSGHYALPLGNHHKILDDAQNGSTKVILHVESCGEGEKTKIAKKLHSQFSHPPAGRLIRLVSTAGMSEDKELIKEIKAVSEKCKVCQSYKKPSPRPVTGFPLATQFNQVVAMDLKMFHGRWILHLIDHVSRFSAALFVSSKRPQEIIDKIFQMWICHFGPPQKFLSDNGGEFNNREFQSLCESFNITILTTAAEAPWSNGLCERHNAVLADMLEKTVADKNCDMSTALNWAIHAKNSLANVHGFTPYQIAIGHTPVLPSNLFNAPPALESGKPSSQIVADNLSGIAAARKAFVEAESSERVKRALSHNIRSSGKNKFFTGDVVYYKRNDCRKWRGPGKVIGQDSQQILIKHGGVYVRVHPCRVLHGQEHYLKPKKKQNELESGQADRDTIDHPEHTEEYLSSSSDQSENEDNNDDKSETSEEDGEIIEKDINEPSNESDYSFRSAENDGGNSDNSMNEASNSSQREIVKPKKGMSIEYQPKNKNDWVKATIQSRAGKASGKYQDYWNVVENGITTDMNLGEIKWRCAQHESPLEIEEVDNQEVNLCATYVAVQDEQTLNAKKLELENWKRECVYEEVDDVGQNSMSVRWVVTPKIIDGVWSTKARLVARGFEEDKSELRTDSPTCMRETLKIGLGIAASKKWTINSIDIKAAFLQGKPITRDLYLKPPKEAVATGKLWRLKKVVYGLSDASRIWYMRVVDELSNLGVKLSKYDKALFLWQMKGQVDGILLVHVDDFLWAGSEMFENSIISQLKGIFKISKEDTKAFRYLGIDLKQENDKIVISQKEYTSSIQPITVPKLPESNQHEIVQDPKFHKAFRGIVGQISWAAGVTRPDAAFNACILSTFQAQPTCRNLLDANKALRDLKSSEVQISYPCMDLKSIKIVIYADASYGNLHDGGSMGGHIVFLSDINGACAPISWASKRIARVVRSTLAAETLSAVDAMDSAHLTLQILLEFLPEKKKEEIVVDLFTDNKSLFDLVNTSNLTRDKRLRVDVAALREISDRGEAQIRWIDSKNQIADVLTKKGAAKTKLLDVLEKAHLRP